MNNKPPKNWNRVTLGEILDYERPDKYIVSSEEYNDSYKTPVLTAGKTFILGYTDENDGIYENIPVIIFDDFTTESKYVDFNFKVKSSAMKILKAENNTTLKYLYYLMQTIPFNHETHKRYWISEYSKLKIDIPEKIEEQQEILQVLDTMSDIIRLREECISLAQELIFAIFREMFGDVLKRVENVRVADYFDVGTGGTPSREKLDEFYNNGYIPWVKTTEVNNCYINKTEEKITELALKQTNCTLYPENTILMAMYGQGKTRGKVAYLNISATTNQACAALQLKPQINNVNTKYVFYYLQYIYDYLRTLSQGGGRPNMNLSIVRKIPLYLPSINLQNAYSENVTELELYIKEQQEELENAKQMFQSLLHHAFTGELTRRAYGND